MHIEDEQDFALYHKYMGPTQNISLLDILIQHSHARIPCANDRRTASPISIIMHTHGLADAASNLETDNGILCNQHLYAYLPHTEIIRARVPPPPRTQSQECVCSGHSSPCVVPRCVQRKKPRKQETLGSKTIYLFGLDWRMQVAAKRLAHAAREASHSNIETNGHFDAQRQGRLEVSRSGRSMCWGYGVPIILQCGMFACVMMVR